jgi:hypothetical protein
MSFILRLPSWIQAQFETQNTSAGYRSPTWKSTTDFEKRIMDRGTRNNGQSQICNGGKPQVTNTYLDGDVILIIGVEKLRLRVDSQSLRSASKVFSAMFGPDWREGKRTSAENLTDIELPEDDTNAMLRVCYILHDREDLVPKNYPRKKFFKSQSWRINTI